ncbi:MAG: hypothetical protein ACOYL8_05060 [Patescibacteria group bacterium]
MKTLKLFVILSFVSIQFVVAKQKISEPVVTLRPRTFADDMSAKKNEKNNEKIKFFSNVGLAAKRLRIGPLASYTKKKKNF